MRDRDLAGLATFGADYPMAKRWLLYGGTKRERRDGVELLPLASGLLELVAAL